MAAGALLAPWPVGTQQQRQLRAGDSFMLEIAEKGRVLYEAVHP